MVSILVVEDHPVFAQMLCNALSRSGPYEPDPIGSAEAALDHLQSHSADLVLVDISLPEHNGVWLIEQLAEQKSGLPTLVLTGYNRQDYLKQSLKAGARGFVVKDDLPGLLEGIRTVLGGGTYVSKGASFDDPRPDSF